MSKIVEVSKLLTERGRAGYAALYLQTYEDQLALREVKKAAEALKRKMFFWTAGKGLLEDGKRTSERIPETETPYGVCDKLLSMPAKSIIVLRGFHHHLDDPLVQANLLDIIPEYKLSNRMIVVSTPVVKIPPELEKEFTLVEMGLPTEEALTAVLDGILQNTASLKAHQRPSPERRKTLIDSAKGLTTQEAESAFSLSIIEPKEEGKDGAELWEPKIVMREKCLALRKNGILEYIKVDEGGLGMIGGLDNLKEYVTPLQRAFTPAALQFGLTWPKGILLVGPPGAGKSLGAKAISSTLNMPLLKLDMGRIYQSLVGSSEANIRLAIRVAEAIAPCILWLDEIEKGVSGSGAGALDSGVSARVLGTLLTWMQEKQTPVFVYATANDVTMLPPELLRKGRFDEMFSVDIPTKKERKEILEIHIRKRNRGHLIGKGGTKIDLDHFCDETSDGFTGAEIEGAIEQAMRVAFHNSRDLNMIDLQDAFDSTQPISKTMQERLNGIRAWCKARTRPANKTEAPAVSVGAPGRKVEA